MILSILAISFVALLLLGCGKTPDTKDTAPAHKIGEELDCKDWKWVVMDVKDRGKLMTAEGNPNKEAKTDGKFIQVHLKATNVNDQGGVWYLTLVDSKGKEYDEWTGTKESMVSAFYPGGIHTEGLYGAQRAKTGKTIECYALFDVPADVTGLKARLSGGVGANAVTWFVDLGL
jgi:hypothetical protein